MKEYSMKTKVLFIINALGGGGAERALTTILGTEIFREKLDIHLLLLENKISYDLPDYVKVHVATDIDEKAGKMKKALSIPAMLGFVKELKKEINPEVSVSFLTRSNIINVLTRNGSEKVLISERNNPVKTYGNNPLVRFSHRSLLSAFYPKADGVIAVSEGVRKSLLSYIKIDESKVITINNPYDTERIEMLSQEEMGDEFRSIFSGDPVLITVGRLTHQKGHDTFLKAVSLVRKKYPIKVVIMGEGELEQNLKDMAEELGISETVHFMGWQANPFCYIRNSTLFVLPSRWEGFPNALVEAMACGCPVVASRCESGPEEILQDNRFGLLAKVDDAEELAKKIFEMMEDAEKRKEYGRLAKERAGDFHREKIAGEYMKVIRR